MRRSVSGAVETVKCVGAFWGVKDVTVKQVPLTEIESPSPTSVRIGAQSLIVKVVPVVGECVIEDIAGGGRG